MKIGDFTQDYSMMEKLLIFLGNVGAPVVAFITSQDFMYVAAGLCSIVTSICLIVKTKIRVIEHKVALDKKPNP